MFVPSPTPVCQGRALHKICFIKWAESEVQNGSSIGKKHFSNVRAAGGDHSLPEKKRPRSYLRSQCLRGLGCAMLHFSDECLGDDFVASRDSQARCKSWHSGQLSCKPAPIFKILAFPSLYAALLLFLV